MKFGTTYEELQKNPLFQKYLPNCKFLDYNKLKKDIKYIKQNIQCSEENKLQFITTLELFLKQTESFILSILNERKQQPEQIKHINTYRSLQEYSQINKEAVRKISKKYDKILEIAPFLQQQMLDKMASMEIGSRSIIQAQILKAELEEQELFEKENFTLLKQDVILLRECSEDVKLMDKDQFEIKNKTAKTNAQIQLYQNSQNMASDYPINLRTDSELKQEDKIKPLEIEQEQVKSTEELTWKQWLKKEQIAH